MTTMNLLDVDNEFDLDCGGELACRAATIHIEVDATKPMKIKNIHCLARRSCQGATIVIENVGDALITVEEIDCESEEACRWATFTIVVNVKVQDCECEVGSDYTDHSCLGATFNGFECEKAPM
eukprot:523393_1